VLNLTLQRPTKHNAIGRSVKKAKTKEKCLITENTRERNHQYFFARFWDIEKQLANQAFDMNLLALKPSVYLLTSTCILHTYSESVFYLKMLAIETHNGTGYGN